MEGISWVCATRDDGFGGSAPGVRDFNLRRIHASLGSIRALARPQDEIVVVDMFPNEGHFLRDRLNGQGARVLTVGKGLKTALDADAGPEKVPFYEFLGKNIGIERARNELVIAFNPDNIFPSINFGDVVAALSQGMVCRAVRLDIPRECVISPDGELIDAANNGNLRVIRQFTSAAGDFTGFSKRIYKKIGGYMLAHGNWHLDNLFIDKARAMGIDVDMNYSHYHIDHDGSVTGEGKNRDWRGFKAISSKILRKVDSYVMA